MNPTKPLYLKTYGKQKRKLSAWISPGNRKYAFDSSRSTDCEASVSEPAKALTISDRSRRTTSARQRAMRPSKKKALQCLKEIHFQEKDNIPLCRQASAKDKTARGHPDRAAKRKAQSSVPDDSSDENDTRMSPSQHQFSLKSMEKRKIRPAPRPTRGFEEQHGPVTCESEINSPYKTCQRNSSQRNETSNIFPPSVGRFVTRRRNVVSTKNKLRKPLTKVLNSSEEFTSQRHIVAFSKAVPCSKQKKRGRSKFRGSGVENSLSATGADSFLNNSSQDRSLSELSDNSLRPCHRKPIFCSTPSASSVSKRLHTTTRSISDQTSIPPSMSISCIDLGTSQDDIVSQKQLYHVPPVLLPEDKQQLNLGEVLSQPGPCYHEEPSASLFLEPNCMNKKSCEEVDQSNSENLKHKKDGALSSINQFTVESEISYEFVSAAEESYWLKEALKEKCLKQCCTVKLRRLDNLIVAQLCNRKTYCLNYSSSTQRNQIGQTSEHLPSSNLAFSGGFSVNQDRTSEQLLAGNSLEGYGQAASVNESEITNHSLSVDFNQLSKNECIDQFEEVGLASDSALNADESDRPLSTEDSESLPYSKEIIEKKSSLRHFSNNPTAQMPSNAPETVKEILIERCMRGKLSVVLKRLNLFQSEKNLRSRDEKLDSTPDIIYPTSDEQTTEDLQSEIDSDPCEEVSAVTVGLKNGGTTMCDSTGTETDKIIKNTCEFRSKLKNPSVAQKVKKQQSKCAALSRTARRACVSGWSANRWKNNSSTSSHILKEASAIRGSMKTQNCSISEMFSTGHKLTQPSNKRPTVGGAKNFSTPVRASQLNLSSLLTDLTPNTQTWSRLKAALSVHRKVLLTPRSLQLSGAYSPGRAGLLDISKDLFATPLKTPRSNHLWSQLQSSDSQVVCEDISDAEKVYAECNQPGPLSWEKCIVPQRMKQCVKIGEGTFGEVFSITDALGDTVALKVIPVGSDEKVNGEDQKTFGEILHEIIISKELSSLKEKQQNQTQCFIGLKDLHCVQGSYPAEFLKAWDTFDQEKCSENDRPDFFKKDQSFLILEFEFGGVDLENSNGTLASLGVAKSILHQVTAALAVAEQELRFEHRDLHWGNVLVKPTKQKKGSFLLNGTTHTLETKGVLVRIIDYSLSRLEIDDLTVSCDISTDEELFMGHGDYQFDIYRLMRQENGNNWRTYHPRTNVMWLHYLCSKLLSMKYRGTGGRVVKDMRVELTRFYDNILQYNSATETLQKCPMFQ